MTETAHQDHDPVTRIEIIDAVEEAFDGTPPSKQQLITAASQHHSRDAVLKVLDALPERQFRHVRDLWDHLPDVPLGD
ncbi:MULTISPECIES: DUF2795 domain-containing protein [Prauserella salsuginis group]|uniref:DUF2795 domain-containing protein n=1 Tax=Prauserella salsuginis TaxID=387889 RepID=A0ABW6G7J6_9PSEU|nr:MULTISPECIES: DUF2795 domain-containing protein [Prauserella salsuginis group]MCR3719539.1 Protein of unknown function (DUF2795) [Prauserella flava]MCR3735447.1 Protein of unknown function (DUF2795) [Prauserella salsuginis]